ncbi:MAG: GTP-binding protein [Bacillaceae bacterium]|nr:GTP-binding protein [Bacillaceae bacterium]
MLLLIVILLSACGTGTPVTQPDPDPQEKSESDNDKKTDPSEQDDLSDETEPNEDATDPDQDENEQVVKPEKQKPSFSYPDAVRGIYVTGHSAGGSRFEELVQLVDSTDLNAMVIDIKDDYGNITFIPEDEPEDSPLRLNAKPIIKDPEALLKTLSEHNIYPIARIVVFKDSVLASQRPDLSFKQYGAVWKNGRKEAFVNPYMKEVWEYNVAVAKKAIELGFPEVQFDYVRFPEGFHNKQLEYQYGDYVAAHQQDPIEARVQAVTDFVAYAKEQLAPLGVAMSVDVFGYTVTLDSAPNIGQSFSRISEHVDVISSMIYPSHWGPYNLGIPKPDLEPYRLVQNYVVKEKEKLFRLENPPTSRPWIQDFTARWLGAGNYKTYGKADVEAQIRALNEAGIREYLIWNAGNKYTPGVDYTPEIDQQKKEEILRQDELLRQQIEEERLAKEKEALEQSEQPVSSEGESVENQSSETEDSGTAEEGQSDSAETQNQTVTE